MTLLPRDACARGIRALRARDRVRVGLSRRREDDHLEEVAHDLKEHLRVRAEADRALHRAVREVDAPAAAPSPVSVERGSIETILIPRWT